MVTVESAGSPSDIVLAEINIRSPDTNLVLVRVCYTLIRRTRGVPIGKGATTARGFFSGPSLELTDMHRSKSVARQRGPVDGPQNDEQRSDHLFDPSSYQKLVRRSGHRKHKPESD